MLNLKEENNNYPLPTILEKLATINETSNLIPFLTYPIVECYINWKNIFIDEYPIRSSIRAIISTGAFIIGPILTEVVNFTWLKDRCYGLYQTIPVFNLLPADVGTGICSAYACGYFLTWASIELTDIYNSYKFGGTAHYLTEEKAQQIHQIISNNNFNISPEEMLDIFNKINTQLRKDPKNRNLTNMIVSLRKGDFQTILDNAHLLETEISIINNKINTLVTAEQLNYTPIINNASIASLPEDIPLTENISEPLEVSENHSNPSINGSPTNNQDQSRYARVPSEQEHPDRNCPPIAGILHQYQNNVKNKKRAPLNNNMAIEALEKHKTRLKDLRFIKPNKSYNRL